jgi:hypothetical protein
MGCRNMEDSTRKETKILKNISKRERKADRQKYKGYEVKSTYLKFISQSLTDLD